MTAFELERAGLRVALLEASDRVGGAMATHREGPYLFELGPNTVVESDTSVGRLVDACGLAKERIAASPAAKRRYIWKGGQLVPLPTSPFGLVGTPLFPWSAKLRLLREPWVPRYSGRGEESVAAFVRRRLGPALLDDAVAPFVSGVYAGDPERLAVRWALPRLAELEAKHGSLLRGAFAGRPRSAPGERRPTGRMFSLRDGLDTLPRRIAERIGDVRTGVAATSLARSGDGYRVETPAGPLAARRVVLAVPADGAAALLAGVTEGRSLALAEIPYVPVAVVNAAFRRSDLAHPLDGFGFLVPRQQDLRLLGCLFPATIFAGRAPEGEAVLTVFLGGRTDPEAAGLDDGELLHLVRAELGRALGLRGEPLAFRVTRWPRAIPQYELGHGRFVELGAAIERENPGLHLGGNFLRGISVPDGIRNATALAARIAAEAAA